MNHKQSVRIAELDGIRAVAILMVIFVHYFFIHLAAPENSFLLFFYKLSRYTWSGVDLFFVLSGYLIGGILIDNKDSASYFKTFFVRRFLRIFPLYYFILFIFIILNLFSIMENMPGLFNSDFPYWSYLTYTQNIYSVIISKPAGLTWSLTIEEQFYIFFPFIVYFARNKSLPKIFWTLIIISICLKFVHLDSYYLQLLPYRMDALLTGALIAYYLRIEKFKDYLIENIKFLYLIFAGLVVIFAFLVISDIMLNEYFAKCIVYILLNLIFGMFLIFPILNKKSYLSKILRNRILQKIGLVSYGMYLYHFPILIAVFKIFLNKGPGINNMTEFLLLFLSIFITVGVSLISYYYFEKKFLKLSAKYTY